MRTIAVTNHKGGSAKTTTAVNLAAAVGEGARRVLLIDLDPQGSASAWLGVRDPEVSVIDAIRGRAGLAQLVYQTTAPGVQLVAASPALIATDRRDETEIALGFLRAIERLPRLWDVVIVDCPPSLGYLSIAPLTGCAEVLLPVEAHVLALEGIGSLLETMDRIHRRLNPDLRLSGVLACRVNRTAHARSVVERLERRFPHTLLRAQVRESIRLAEAPSFRLPITRYAPDSAGAEDYRAVAAEFIGPPLIAELEETAPRVREVASARTTAVASVGLAGGSALAPSHARAGTPAPSTLASATARPALGSVEPTVTRVAVTGAEPMPGPTNGPVRSAPTAATEAAGTARRLFGSVVAGWKAWLADEVDTGSAGQDATERR